MNPTVILYIAYTVVCALFTIWVGCTLHRNGRVFLVDSFLGNEPLADSVNHLLVVGFYLINAGFILFALKTAQQVDTAQRVIEVLSGKVGLVVLILGLMHFFNLFVFTRMRRRALLHQSPPPVQPQGYVTVGEG
jgi:hypothetical protein